MQDNYLTVADVSKLLRISYDKALELLKHPDIESIRVGRQYRILESKLNEFLYPKKQVKKKITSRPIYQLTERT